jgi:hypothetical protein
MSQSELRQCHNFLARPEVDLTRAVGLFLTVGGMGWQKT